jgi:hypothetical protein
MVKVKAAGVLAAIGLALLGAISVGQALGWLQSGY